MKFVVDLWSGPRSHVLVARFIRSHGEALQIAAEEMGNGILVVLRRITDDEETAWGPDDEFDDRERKLQS